MAEIALEHLSKVYGDGTQAVADLADAEEVAAARSGLHRRLDGGKNGLVVSLMCPGDQSDPGHHRK